MHRKWYRARYMKRELLKWTTQMKIDLHKSTQTQQQINIRTYIRMHMDMYSHICVCIYVYIHTSVHVYVYVYAYVHICTHICPRRNAARDDASTLCASYFASDWGRSHEWMHHVSAMNEQRLTNEWTMSHLWMSHISLMGLSCLPCDAPTRSIETKSRLTSMKKKAAYMKTELLKWK